MGQYHYVENQDTTPDPNSVSQADLVTFADSVKTAIDSAISAVDTAIIQCETAGRGRGSYDPVRSKLEEAKRLMDKNWRS